MIARLCQLQRESFAIAQSRIAAVQGDRDFSGAAIFVFAPFGQKLAIQPESDDAAIARCLVFEFDIFAVEIEAQRRFRVIRNKIEQVVRPTSQKGRYFSQETIADQFIARNGDLLPFARGSESGAIHFIKPSPTFSPSLT